MATLLPRTTLANGANATVVTDSYNNIVINVHSGNASVDAIIDSAQSDGYKFKQPTGASVVAAAYSLSITGIGDGGCEVEVYAP